MIALLGDALSRGLTISSAIRHIHEETGSHAELLAGELAALRFQAADQLLEAAITMRGVARAFDETVMDAIDTVVEREDNRGIVALAVGWASDHALHCRRLATAPSSSSVVVVDCSKDHEALRAASDILQLQLRLHGFATHALRGVDVLELQAIVRLACADAVLFVGRVPDVLARAPFTGDTAIGEFRGDRGLGGAQLSPRPRAAADELSALARRAAGTRLASATSNGRV